VHLNYVFQKRDSVLGALMASQYLAKQLVCTMPVYQLIEALQKKSNKSPSSSNFTL
jgi:hypothetical protein